MSNIDTQIKQLLLKKKKIDYIAYIVDLISNDTKCIDYKEVQAEVLEKIKPFLSQLGTSIETDTSVTLDKNDQFTNEQVSILKLLAQKALAKNSESSVQTSKPSQPKQESNSELSPSEKINFALTNRHLGGKRVHVLSDETPNLYGTVVGLDAPVVVVKTENGPVIKVPVNKVVLA